MRDPIGSAAAQGHIVVNRPILSATIAQWLERPLRKREVASSILASSLLFCGFILGMLDRFAFLL